MAQLTEDISGTAGAVVRLGANVTEGAAQFVSSVGNGGLTLAGEAWRGVDLINVSAQREDGRILADDSESFAQWLNSSQGRGLVPVPSAARELLQKVVGAVAVALPRVERTSQSFEAEGKYAEFSAEAMLLSSGYVAARWSYASVTFASVWSNPLWAIADLDPQTQLPVIQRRLSEALARMASQAGTDKTLDEALYVDEHVPLLLFSRLRRMRRCWSLWFRRAFSWMLFWLW